jgi:lipid-binding SYLF domain-containing protein
MQMKSLCLAIVLAGAVSAASVQAAGWNPQGQTQQLEEAQATIAKFKSSDRGLDEYFKKAYGFAVFPSIGKGGFIFAGAFGRGLVYQHGKPIGRTSVAQASFGLQIGGQAFSEILFFKDQKALDHFKTGSAELSAQASAVVARDGAAAATSYDSNGVAVFVMIMGGAMLEASVGGQKFDYQPGLDE